MNVTSLCAVVITFCPPSAVIENLEKLRPQVGGLVVVDNGSPADLLVPLRAAAHRLRFTLVENDLNVGIAAALNSGVRWAQAHGYSCVLLFDQDSTVTGIFCRLMLAAYESHALRDKVAVVTPSQVEKSTGRRRGQSWAKDGGPLVAITSGSLMPVAIFDQCGWFQEELVIDCVDHEFCLRARSLGFTLAECREAVLMVAVGSGSIHQAFGLTISARNYSAPRRYYLTRNRLVMVLRFWRQHPGWCCRALQDIAQDGIKILLVEEQRWSKTWNTARGIADALCGRMGKVVEL
jgi:rhamnosyltransferase